MERSTEALTAQKMARHSTLVVVAAFASAAMVAYMASTASTGFVGSRTAVRASVDRSMPVPFMQSGNMKPVLSEFQLRILQGGGVHRRMTH